MTDPAISFADATPLDRRRERHERGRGDASRAVRQFDQYVKLNKKIPPEILTSMSGIDDGGRLADTIAAHLPLKLEQKQDILEMQEVVKRLEHLLGQARNRARHPSG